METNNDDIEVDAEYHTSNVTRKLNPGSTKSKENDADEHLSLFDRVVTKPILIEVIVVAVVLLSAIISSELGIYLGKTHDSHSKY